MAIDLKGFQKMSAVRQLFVVVGVLGSLGAMFWYWYIKPMGVDLEQRAKTLETLKQQNEKSVKQLQQFAKLKEESEALQAELDRLKMDLPLEKETHEILEDIQKKVSGSHLKIMRVGPRATIDHDFYTEWPWEFEVIGSYHNIGAFLDRVRALPRIVSVSNMKINSRASGGPEAQLTNIGVTFTAMTYVYKDEPTPQEAAPVKK